MDIKQSSPASMAYDGPKRSNKAPATAATTITPPITTTAVTAPTQSFDAAKDIAYGSVAGSIGKIVEYPFDTVKVRLQSQPDHLPLRYAGPLDCFRQSMRSEGISGLYRGISAPLFGAAAETACLFFSYRVAKDALKSSGLVKVDQTDEEGSLPLGGLITAGAISGGLTSIVLTPIELVKCRMQVPFESSPVDPTLRRSRATPSSGVMAVIRQVYRSEGFAGFWRGQMGTLIREMGGSAAWFGTYETLSLYFKTKLQRSNSTKTTAADSGSLPTLPVYQQMLSGAVAGVAYNFLFFPADTIKSKIQTGDLGPVTARGVKRKRVTFWNVGLELWKSHGLKGLYRGCGITVLRSAPSSALIFSVYEALKTHFA